MAYTAAFATGAFFAIFFGILRDDAPILFAGIVCELISVGCFIGGL